MPKIFDYIGYIFFFYANAHSPVNCHIRKGGKEMSAELLYINNMLCIHLKKVNGMEPYNAGECSVIQDFIINFHTQIFEKWTTFIVHGKRPGFANIKSIQ